VTAAGAGTRAAAGAADVLWALEQALKSGHVGAVLAWLPARCGPSVRRLQLAAQAHDGPAFLLRDAAAQARPSAAPLRLLLASRPGPTSWRCASSSAAGRRWLQPLRAGAGAGAVGTGPGACAARRGAHRPRWPIRSRRPTTNEACALPRRSCPCCGSPSTCRGCRSRPSAATLPAEQRRARWRCWPSTRSRPSMPPRPTPACKPGLKRATALALAPELLLGQADATRDAQALQAVVHAALAFTPAVALLDGRTVLLEVASCLRYFGGADTLLQRLRAGAGSRWATACRSPRAHGAGRGAAGALARRPGRRPAAHAAGGAAGPAGRSPGVAAGPRPRTLGGAAGHGPAPAVRPAPPAARRAGAPLRRRPARRPGPCPRHTPRPACVADRPRALRAGWNWPFAPTTADQVLHGAALLLAPLVAWAQARQSRVAGLHAAHAPRARTAPTRPHRR
jgi:hypothetical protein